MNVASSTANMDFLQLSAEYAAYTADTVTYNGLKTTYDAATVIYNKALADEKLRKDDFFKSMFEPAVSIPERPCQPTRQMPFSGIDFKYAQAAAPTVAEKLAGVATFTQNDGVANVASSFKLGYLLSATADTAWNTGV
jgi:hypothetical protein